MRVVVVALAVLCLLTTACDQSGSGKHATSRTAPAAPDIDPASFSTHVTNRYFPLVPGLTYIYEGTRGGTPVRNNITVTHDTKRVASGVTCVIVQEVVYLDGEKREEALDYYAQSAFGAVWHFGHAARTFRDDGSVKATAGSWEAGARGAQPAIVMPAEPKPGAKFSHAEVVETGETVSVPLSTYKDAIVTKDYAPLEPDQVEHKTYAPGVGFVQSDMVKGGKEHVALVRVISS